MKKLIEGIAHYTHEVHGVDQGLFDELAKGQSPRVLFLTCADSRVAPGLITQTKPGEIFVSRNVGNVVPPSDSGLQVEATIASIEYGVKALQLAHIVICGHTDCGAVKGALAPESVESLPHVRAWLQWVDHGGHQDLHRAIESNVLAQLDHLRTYDFVNEAVEAGSLSLWGCVYDIGVGQVRIFDGTKFAASTPQ